MQNTWDRKKRTSCHRPARMLSVTKMTENAGSLSEMADYISKDLSPVTGEASDWKDHLSMTVGHRIWAHVIYNFLLAII